MAVQGGYNGKVLRVDLETCKIRADSLLEEMLKFLGGSSLGAKILYDELDSAV